MMTASAAPLVEVRSGPWKGRRIASPVGADELRVASGPGTVVYHHRADGWHYFIHSKEPPTGFVVFAYPPKEQHR